MTDDFFPHALSLKRLLQDINSGKLVLPQFQRNFRWYPKDTKMLVISLLKNYPSGALLFLNYKKGILAERNFELASTKSKKPDNFVLDGQQRLTSLYHALYGLGEYKYFLDLNRLNEGQIDEDTIVVFTQKDFLKEVLDKPDTQFERKLMPLEAIFYKDNGFGKVWGELYAEYKEKKRKGSNYGELKWFNSIRDSFIKKIEDYSFAVVELPEDLELLAICQIFETLNNTGMKLNVFEILTARLWFNKINLRQLWEDSLESYATLKEFDIEPVDILRTISLIDTENINRDKKESKISCKRDAILELNHRTFKDTWNLSVKMFDTALKKLKNECGVINKDWLPYSAILSPMAAMLAYQENLKPEDKLDVHDKMMRWMWCSIFSRSYDASTDTQSSKDYGEFIKWIRDEIEPKTVKAFSFDPEILKSITKANDVLYKGVICLVIKNHAIDFDGNEITTQALIEKDIDDHHIFPTEYMKGKERDGTLIDCVLNKTLLSAEMNRSIKSKSPKDYLTEKKQSLNHGVKFAEILKSHLLPTEDASPLFTNGFRDFLEKRKELIDSAIKRATS